MNYNEVEKLVELAKNGDIKAKESLAEEFTPLIVNLSKRSYINSYEFSDIRNECYETLFKCLSLYDLDKHRFVAYATNAIKNTVNNLIRTSVRRNDSEGPGAFILDDKLENILCADTEDLDDIIFMEAYKPKLLTAITALSCSEQELIIYVYFRGYTLKRYADFKGLSYSSAVNKKKSILKKLKSLLSIKKGQHYLN